MKVTITLTDHESGHVQIDSDPPGPVLSRKRRDGADSPAESYAILALGTIYQTSIKEAQEKMKQKVREGKIILPRTPRFTPPN